MACRGAWCFWRARRAARRKGRCRPAEVRTKGRVGVGGGAWQWLGRLSGPGFDYNLPSMTTPAKTYDVRIEKFPPRRVAYMRHIGPYVEVGPTFQKFMAWAGAHGLFGPDTLAIGIGHDNPATTPAEKLRYDACVTVGDDFKPEGEA